MSYPDGGPRFIVRESRGFPNAETRSKTRTEIMVLDRGYCHQVVWSSLDDSSVMNWSVAKRRAYAEMLAQNLEDQQINVLPGDTLRGGDIVVSQ